MNKKTAIVTGAYGSIGFAIARSIATIPGHRVWLVGRDEASLVKVTEDIRHFTGNPDVSYKLADLSLKEDIYSLSNTWNGPLHILINNAATCPRERTENTEGIEMQFATNVLGYFRMIKAFEMILKASAPSRIVNVASYWAGDMDILDLEFVQRRYNNNTAYRQSKQADRMLTKAFAKKYSEYGITVNASHPGDVNSKLSNSLGFGGHESPDQGAATPVWVGTSPELEGVTGKYFENHTEQKCRFSQNLDECNELLAICDRY